MNSYPHEFLAHPQPLMFVAGLNPSSSSSTTNRDRSASASTSAILPAPASPTTNTSNARRGSSTLLSGSGPGSGVQLQDNANARSRSGSMTSTALLNASATQTSAGNALTTPVSSPAVHTTGLPAPATDSPTTGTPPTSSTSPVPPATEEARREGQGDKEVRVEVEAEAVVQEDEFEALIRNMREALGGLDGKGKVWLPEAQRRDFKIMLVDKGIRLPLRKVSPSHTSPASSSSEHITPHSPLSPLTSTSPLHPDGLMAPIWVKKHLEIVPSVFVLFLRLYESPTWTEEERANLDPGATQAKRETERAKEKEADEGLVREIGERRRRLGERGIKLTVVLMASAEALESPALDSRLSYLRRASSLSTKASLFVLSPVSADQLPEFVQSLQDALYDSAMEYYGSHAKRVKRKRSRLPSSPSALASASAGAGNGAPGKALGAQGWAVRYDWKAGWFAEMRGEFEEARRHYEDCWNELARMFSSTQVLPPRTKRWAEAKVLADCVAMRICRLLLYSDEGSKVLGPFFIHLKRFGDLSRGWGIGEETFEFWSWIARQYRIFAELLELGAQSGLRTPRLAAPIFPSVQSAVAPPSMEALATPISANNPLQILQSPAFYFYTAALCSVQRQKRFHEALSAEEESMEASIAAGYSATTSPGYDNEKKVDHAALIVELYTKAYSLVKDQEHAHDRVGLYLAYRIAETYCSSDQYELAMRFFERISTSFKRDQWAPIVRQIRELWYTCAQRTGHVEHAARLLVEMMCADSGVEGEDRLALQDDLSTLMKTTTPSSPEPIRVEMAPLVRSRIAFWQGESHISEAVPFQITLECPRDVHIDHIPFFNVIIEFSGDVPDLVIEHEAASAHAAVGLTRVDVGSIGRDTEGRTVKADLRFAPGRRLILCGTVAIPRAGVVHINSLRLSLKESSWHLDIALNAILSDVWYAGDRILKRESIASVTFAARPFDVMMDPKSPDKAFMGEVTKVEVQLRNQDDRDVSVRLSGYLHPVEEADGASSENLADGVDLGIIKAGSTMTKVISLHAASLGRRELDIAAHIRPVPLDSSATSAEGGVDHNPRDEVAYREGDRLLEDSVAITTIRPFDVRPHVTYGPVHRDEKGARCLATVSMSFDPAGGGGGVEVENIALESSSSTATSLVWSSLTSLDSEEAVPLPFTAVMQFEVKSPSLPSDTSNEADSVGQVSIKWRSATSTTTTTSLIPLPFLALPHQDTFLSARITHPPTAHLQQPFDLSLRISNSHPSQPAANLLMQVDTSETFVWHGNRSARIPIVPPEGEVEVKVKLIPVAMSGRYEIPRIRVLDGDAATSAAERGVAVRVDVESGGIILIRP